MQPSLYMPIMTRKSHQPRHLVVGTRASPLAQAQTRQIVQLLCAQGHFAPPQIKITALATRGDAALDIAGETPLADIGGKGLFTAELDAALRDGRIDFAVHSLKDLPTALPDDLVLAAVPPRGDARDVLVYHSSAHAALATDAASAPPDSVLQNLPQGAKIGTASLRRAAQLCALHPDCVVAPLRGNIGTRLDKLEITIGQPLCWRRLAWCGWIIGRQQHWHCRLIILCQPQGKARWPCSAVPMMIF